MFSVWCPSVEDPAWISLNDASKILVRGDGVVAVTSLVADSCFMTSSDSIQCPASKLNAARAGLLRISWFFMVNLVLSIFCKCGGMHMFHVPSRDSAALAVLCGCFNGISLFVS
ncbi:hypothetical protein AKJ16_DCAP02845 [Drosera capensis]